MTYVAVVNGERFGKRCKKLEEKWQKNQHPIYLYKELVGNKLINTVNFLLKMQKRT